jgi:hypothetical protein
MFPGHAEQALVRLELVALVAFLRAAGCKDGTFSRFQGTASGDVRAVCNNDHSHKAMD